MPSPAAAGGGASWWSVTSTLRQTVGSGESRALRPEMRVWVTSCAARAPRRAGDVPLGGVASLLLPRRPRTTPQRGRGPSNPSCSGAETDGGWQHRDGFIELRCALAGRRQRRCGWAQCGAPPGATGAARPGRHSGPSVAQGGLCARVGPHLADARQQGSRCSSADVVPAGTASVHHRPQCTTPLPP